MQALTGIMDMTGEPDHNPVRLPIAVNDMGAGMWAVIGILSSLLNRQITGKGCLVETSLIETAAWWMNYHITSYLATGVSPTRCGTGTPFIAPYEVYPASDEGLLVCVGNDNLFRSFVEELQLSELAVDERFATNPMRVKNRDELRELIIGRFRTRTAVEWEVRLKARSIPCSRIHNVAEFVESGQFQALEMLKPVPHPLIPDLRLLDMPVSLNRERAAHQFPPPLLGEQADQVLSGLGYDRAEIKKMREDGIIG
jgi:crotonobetainyl-CoA:carnitine CoA-transferase CaiB-like acyl-CoA transferase